MSKLSVILVCLGLICARSGYAGETEFRNFMRSGVAAMEQGDSAAALKAFQNAVGDNPKSTAAHQAMGIAHLQRGSYYEAVAAFEKVAQLKPDLAEAYFYIGITYAQYLEDPLSAEEYFLKAVQLNPSYGRAYH